MIIHVSSPALPHLRPALQLAGLARPIVGVEARGTAGAAARGRRAAPEQSAAPAGLGRPGDTARADPAAAQTAAGTPASHTWHHSAMASSPGQKEADLPEPHRTPAGQRRDHRAHRAARHREPRLGIPAHPGRTAQARPPGQRLHHPPRPQIPADSASAEAEHRHDMAAVPARPGRDHPRHRLLPRGLRGDLAAPVLVLRDRGRTPGICISSA